MTLEIILWVCLFHDVNFLVPSWVLGLSCPVFIVDETSVGQSKAKCVCASLQELNDAVKAKFIEEYPEALIKNNPSFFYQFTLVVATQVNKISS